MVSKIYQMQLFSGFFQSDLDFVQIFMQPPLYNVLNGGVAQLGLHFPTSRSESERFFGLSCPTASIGTLLLHRWKNECCAEKFCRE